MSEIPSGSLLMVLYISMFVFAEAAFILMAIKEYLQDLVGLSEMELIKGPQRPEVNIIRSAPEEGSTPDDLTDIGKD